MKTNVNVGIDIKKIKSLLEELNKEFRKIGDNEDIDILMENALGTLTNFYPRRCLFKKISITRETTENIEL